MINSHKVTDISYSLYTNYKALTSYNIMDL